MKIIHSEKNKAVLSENDDLNFSKIEEINNSNIREYIANLVDNISMKLKMFRRKE